MITLPFELGGKVRDFIDAYRRKNNIPEPEEVKQLSVYRRRDTFLESELGLVTEIDIDKTVLEYLDLFPNITSITVDGINELDGFELKSILEKYPNLEKLTIKGQEKLQFLDVSNLKKLKSLELISNRGLHRVVGIEEIEKLEQLTFYDNIVYNKEEEICEIASKLANQGTHCNFDVLYMPTLNKIGISKPDNFNWCESVGLGWDGEEIKYDTNELEKAVAKAQEVVGKYIKPTDTTIQKYAILYQWMCENVRYDHEALDNGKFHTEAGENVGKLGGTNGTVNGLVYGSCVCEGYSKSMQMLLKICGIPSFDVGCIAEDRNKTKVQFVIDGRKKMHSGDHSILKVNLDGKVYYSDVTWDANRSQTNRERKYFLLSKEDMSVDHQLVGEKQVLSAFKSVSPNEFQELMKYAKDRIQTVDKELEEKAEMEKTPQERLTDINKQLEQLRQQYGVIGKQIEELMIRNQQSSIPNYQEQLAQLTSQRDSIGSNIETLSSSKKTYEWVIQNERETDHKNRIAQVERLLGIHITSNAGFVYDNELKVPRSVSKDTATLRREQGAINKQLEQLYYDGELDLKTYNSMKMEVLKEYDSMVAKAPKPAQPPVRDDSTFTQQQEQNPTPVQHPYINSDIRKKVEDRDLGREQIQTPVQHPYINSDVRKKVEQRKIHSQEPQSDEKKKLEEQRRELRRKQFEERARAMGLDLNQIANLDNLFMQQEMIEQQSIEETEELEEHHGMMM